MSENSFGARADLEVGGRSYEIYRLDALQEKFDVARLPFSLKILLENLLRNEDGVAVRKQDIEALATWDHNAEPSKEIAFTPARVVMQDFTGVPAIVDLAAMRDAMADLGGDPNKINPLVPAELVIDHSVQVDSFGTRDSLRINTEREYERNQERYEFLRWGQTAFEGFVVVPPETGIVHQVNLEYLARVVFENDGVLYPDTLVGTDSHTTMINGLGVLGWGVGGIEAEAAMLGQAMSMLIPRVVGFKLGGELPEGATATDLVLTVTQMLREHGAVGKFVEFYGPGIPNTPLADRATIGNMSPEFGSTCAIFPIDAETLRYMEFTGRSKEQIAIVEAYARAQGLWHDENSEEPTYSETLELDLGDVVPSLAGPKRPQDRVALTESKAAFRVALESLLPDPEPEPAESRGTDVDEEVDESFPASDPPSHNGGHGGPDGSEPAGGGTGGLQVAEREEHHVDLTLSDGTETELDHGHVVIAAITSCTNTSNPSVMIAAGLLAKNAVERGLQSKPWVKTSLAPGSKVVMEYYDKAGLVDSLESLGFHLVGYGCTTCIGNSGPLPEEVSSVVNAEDLAVVSVLERQPQLRGPDQPGREDELPRLAAAGRGLRAGGDDGHRPARRAARPGRRRRGRLPQGHLALRRGRRAAGRGVRARGDVQVLLRRGLRGRRALEGARDPRGRPLRLGRRLDLRAPAHVPGGRAQGAVQARRHRGRARAGQARRLGHHRPHLPGRRDQEGHAGGAVPQRARRRAEGLQLLRLAPRQPRGDGARHLRQHPPAQPARAGHRGWLHAPHAGRRGHDDLRRRDEVRRGRAPRCSSSRARSTARAPHATGRPRAPTCSACAP